MKTNELKPCPFCKGEVWVENKPWSIVHDCGSRRIIVEANSYEELVKAWNTRAGTQTDTDKTPRLACGCKQGDNWSDDK